MSPIQNSNYLFMRQLSYSSKQFVTYVHNIEVIYVYKKTFCLWLKRVICMTSLKNCSAFYQSSFYYTRLYIAGCQRFDHYQIFSTLRQSDSLTIYRLGLVEIYIRFKIDDIDTWKSFAGKASKKGLPLESDKNLFYVFGY